MQKLLVSTFRRLLSVTLSDELDLVKIETVSEGHGIYFGLAKRGPFVFVAERNADIEQAPMTLGDPVDVVRVYIVTPNGRLARTPIYFSAPEFYDLHEIDYDTSGLLVTSSKYPFLIRKSIFGKDQRVDVSKAVPSHLKRHDDHTFDAYHINCVKAHGKDIFVLAHNWDDPSFAMRISRREALKGRVICKQIYENLGSCCHDILPQGTHFWTLDSRGSSLVRVRITDGSQKRFLLQAPVKDGAPSGIPFPRGLGVFADKLAVCYGFNEDRADRMDSSAMLAIFDFKTETFVKHISLGSHGNTCAVLDIKI